MTCSCVLACLGAQVGIVSGTEVDGPLVQLMQQMSLRRHDHVQFTERQYISVLKRPVESSGELFYDAPDRIEKRTLLPKPETMILDRGTVTIRRGTRNYTLALVDHPEIAPLIESIRATLAGELPVIRSAYLLTFEGSPTDWTLTLVPRDARAIALVSQIRIAGLLDRIQEVEFKRADGDRSVMTIAAEPVN